MSDSRVCTNCGETKPLTEFWKKSDSKDGRNPVCAKCAREKNTAYKQRQYYEKRTAHKQPRNVDEPYKALATAILFQAVIVWKRKHTGKAFFKSQWCEILCDLARIEYPAMIEALRIGE